MMEKFVCFVCLLDADGLLLIPLFFFFLFMFMFFLADFCRLILQQGAPCLYMVRRLFGVWI